MNRIFVRAVMALLALATFGSSLVAGAEAKWTIMVYIAANNNLEPNSIINLMEMAEVGSTKDVNIVVQITRPSDYQGFYGEWGGTRRFLVTKSDGQISLGDFQISPTRFTDYVNAIADESGISAEDVAKITKGPAMDREAAAMQFSIPEIETENPLDPLQLTATQDMGNQINSGDGTTLADFGTWAVQNYPAQHYGLVLWDHGGGWSMIASDDELGPGGINMPGLQTALDAITTQTSKKLDFIGFDACLMSQLAVAAVTAPFADYQIAAEELVPGFGWDYTAPLAGLIANPDMKVPEFATLLIDAFHKLYSGNAKEAAGSFDMGLLDLSKIGGVIGSLDQFVTAVKASSDVLGPISTARSNAQAFGSVGEDGDTTDQISAVDMVDFMRLLGSVSKDPDIRSTSKGVIDAVKQMVVYHKTSKTLPNANGLAVYFPKNAEVFANSDGERYRSEFGEYLTTWQSFLDTSYGLASASSAASKIALKISGVTTSAEAPGSAYDTPVISYTIDGQNIVDLTASIIFQLDDGTSVVLDQFPVTSDVTMEDGTQVNDFPDGESASDFYWNTRLPTLSDGKASLLVLMTSNAKDEEHGFIQGIYTNRATGDVNEASLLINLDTYESSGLWVASSAAANAPIAQVFPKPGDTFEPSYTLIDAEGNATTEPSGTKLRFGKKPLFVTEDPGPDGVYHVVLQASDAAGATVTETADVDVNNSEVDPSLQGFKDLNFGLAFLYPSDWTDVSVYSREDGLDELYMTDLSGDLYLSALNFTDTDSLETVQDRMEQEIAAIGDGVLTGDIVDEQFGEYPAMRLPYNYENEDGAQIVGTAIAIYVPETGQGYMLHVEAPETQADDIDAVLSQVMTSAVFFDAGRNEDAPADDGQTADGGDGN